MRFLLILVIIAVVVISFLNRESSSPPPEPLPEPDRRAQFEEAATEAGVQLVAYEQQDRSAKVTVRWIGDVASLGGDFIQQCLTDQIIRDFDLPAKQNTGYQDGRRFWMAEYNVHFRIHPRK